MCDAHMVRLQPRGDRPTEKNVNTRGEHTRTHRTRVGVGVDGELIAKATTPFRQHDLLKLATALVAYAVVVYSR